MNFLISKYRYSKIEDKLIIILQFILIANNVLEHFSKLKLCLKHKMGLFSGLPFINRMISAFHIETTFDFLTN